MDEADKIVLEIFGEGKTDVGPESVSPKRPDDGVIPVLVHKLCVEREHLYVKTRHFPHLTGKKLWQKVKFAKRQAYYNRAAGVVFVMDTEGDMKRLRELQRGRDAEESLDIPTAVGVAHPCIEAWLLSDAKAIRNAMGLASLPEVPEQPEQLPADSADPDHPKSVLERCCGAKSAAHKVRIAKAIRDTNIVRQHCPASFDPFAEEIAERIEPLLAD